MKSTSVSVPPAGYRFPREVIAVAVRWYLRYGLSYRDVEELLAERGIEVDHVTVYRWVQTFTPEFIEAARPSRHSAGNRWFVDETYVKVAGRWSYLYRAVDQHGQVIDVLICERRDAAAARAFLTRALTFGPAPVEVTTDRAAVYPGVLDALLRAARHVLERYANNVIESDHGRLKARLRPMRGLKHLRSAGIVAAGHAFVQNLRRGHYELTAEACPRTTESAPHSPNSRPVSNPIARPRHRFDTDSVGSTQQTPVKGLRPASVRSYRDTIRLLLCFVAEQKRTRITKLNIEDLTFEHVLAFLRYLEDDRHNHVRTRNQRLAALHTLFDYIAMREPDMLGVCQRVTAIPMKRAAPAETHYLERDEVAAPLRQLPRTGRLALRDQALILFLYNTGARVQEVADLRAGHLQLGAAAVVRLHGKGDKWRTCPLWHQTEALLNRLLGSTTNEFPAADTPVFCSATGQALTRFGIYKIVRRNAGHLDNDRTNRKVSPHIFRHTAAVHLLEAGVEINVIRGWLGHADLTTTNRYAEINTRAKVEALSNTEPPSASAEPHAHPVWRTDESLLNWLSSL